MRAEQPPENPEQSAVDENEPPQQQQQPAVPVTNEKGKTGLMSYVILRFDALFVSNTVLFS